jgi:putative endonuclease
MSSRSVVGLLGEDQAAAFLKQQGLRLVSRHFQTRYGEIDLICRDKETWVFVEVKTRTRDTQPSALDAVTRRKQKKMLGAALSYMKKHRLTGENMRFDVVAIVAGNVQWIRNAFEAPSFYTF